jgi:hypothetical protein
MKPGGPPFIGWRGLISAIAIIVCWLFAPAYCQTPDVALLLNSEITLTAEPKPGYQFLYWLGDVSDPGATKTVVYLDKTKIIIAIFGRTENGTLVEEKGLSFGGGGGAGGSGLVNTVANFGYTGGMSSGAGGKAKSPTVVYVKNIEVIPEPATCVLLLLGSLFAFTRRGTKSRP